jgi:hypothetical protein
MTAIVSRPLFKDINFLMFLKRDEVWTVFTTLGMSLQLADERQVIKNEKTNVRQLPKL